MPADHDEAFRRFLERATEEPLDADLRLAPLDPGRRAHRRVRVLAISVAAVTVTAIAAFAARSRDGRTQVSTVEPAATAATRAVTIATTSIVVPRPLTTVPTEPVPTTFGDPSPQSSASSPEPATPTTEAPTSIASASATPTGPVSSSSASTTETTATNTATPSAPVPTATTSVPNAPGDVLRLSLDTVATPATNGTPVLATVGPAMHVEVLGTGSIETVAGGGRRFVPGGQQRYDYAIVTRSGADLAALAPASGRVDVHFVSLVDIAGRSVPTGRNIHTWFSLVSDDRDGDHVVNDIALNIDPEIGPYLAGFIRGTRYVYVLTLADVAAFNAGHDVTLSLEWNTTTGRVLLNDRELTSVALTNPVIDWTASARVAIGGTATYGGGYFTIKDDALGSVVVSAR